MALRVFCVCVVTSCIGHKRTKYSQLRKSSKDWHVSLNDMKKKISFVNITMDLLRQIIKYLVLGIHLVYSGRDQFLKILNFLWKLKFFITGKNCISCFLWSDKLSSYLTKCLLNTQVTLTIPCLLVVISGKNNTMENMARLSHKSNNYTGIFSQYYYTLVCSCWSALCVISCCHTKY